MESRDGWWVFGTVLAWVIGIALILSGLGKIIGFDFLVQMFKNWGLSDFMLVIGVIEIILGILFLVSATSIIAGYLLSAFFGGAIVTHLIAEEFTLVFVPFMLLIIIWVVMFLRKPGVFSD